MLNHMAARIAGRLHVSARPSAVIRAANRALHRTVRRGPTKRAERKRFYRACLTAHEENRALFSHFRF